MKTNSPPMKNTITKSKDNGPQKPYTGDTRTTSANNMLRHRSVEQTADRRRSVRRNRGLSNSNTGPSHTNKKL